MKKINFKRGISIILTAGFIIVGSKIGTILAKDSSDYELKTTPIATLLEDENIQNITMLDEEIASGNTEIIDKDERFRKEIINLEYYASSGEKDSYNETLNWLRDNFEDTSTVILLNSAKGAIADEENKEIYDITLVPAADYNEDSLFLTPEGTVGIKNDYKTTGYTIKSKPINKAVNLAAEIQDMNFNEATAEEIVKLYDEVIETSKMTIASGASRHDDKIEEKNSKKYIKKNFDI